MTMGRKTSKAKRKKRLKRSMNARVRRHFGGVEDVESIKRTFAAYRMANVAVMALRFFRHLDPDAEIAGASGKGSILQKPRFAGKKFVGRDPAKPEFNQIALPRGESLTGLACGVVFFRFEGEPCFAWCWEDGGYSPEYVLSVYARPRERAERIHEAFREFERAESIFRGRLLRPKLRYDDSVKEAVILPRAELDWDDLILSAELRQTLERDLVRFAQAADGLLLNGVDPRRGLLLHGPPGTGKSFICRLLATKLQGFTSILCAGEALESPASVFALARRYAPALLLFEDVDLIGATREENAYKRVLGDLLNELDGIRERDRVYTVFTTNRLEVLEEALARRPGRVDRIVEVPLPDASLRRRLIEHHARRTAADLTDGLEEIVEATEGATPAFLAELVKNAVFAALDAGDVDAAGKAKLRLAHLRTSLRQLQGLKRTPPGALGFRLEPPRSAARASEAARRVSSAPQIPDA